MNARAADGECDCECDGEHDTPGNARQRGDHGGASMSEQHGATGKGDNAAKVLPAGVQAPDFTLNAAPDRTITLSELRGKPVVLAFYPADWSPVCGDQMALYNEILPDFREQGAEIIGISVDGAWCHKAFAEARKLHFPLLADFEPKGAVSRAYGAYADSGVSERALFVIDAGGTIQWSYLSPMGVNPGADGILAALERLTPEQRGAKTNASAVASSGSKTNASSSNGVQAGANAEARR
jgi:peroxiredoxin